MFVSIKQTAMHKYPENTLATLDDFKSSRWKTAIGLADQLDTYVTRWQRLSNAAQAALVDGKAAESKVLWLLADSCSMMLKPKSINEPFAPFAVIDGRRSATPEDFNQIDLALLAEISTEIDEHWIRARLADLVWLCMKPRSSKHALVAIDAYRAITLNAETWAHGASDCWARAIVLAIQLRQGAGTRLQEIEAALVAIFDAKLPANGFFHLHIARLLFEKNLAHERALHIADTLAKHGVALVGNGDHFNARGYLEEAAYWYGRIGDKAQQADMICAVAETWANEAIARANSDQPSQMVASSLYEKAIQAYRKIPKTLRVDRKVDNRITELHTSLSTSGQASLKEMRVISSGKIDITEFVKVAQESVRGKSLLDALAALANVYRGARKKRIEEFSEKMLREHPMQALISATHMSHDGRVVARRPGMNFGDQSSDDYRLTLWAEMVKHYSMEIGLIVQGQIWPALHALLIDHRIRESDLVQIVAQSPAVPDGRVALIAKALFAGFEQDLVSALHLLVPQVEHLVRWHLKSVGAKTTTLSQDGIENENGLSTLIDLPEVVKIFGDDLAFELKALFCDAFGPNLRNEVAHGLLDDSNCHSAQAVYAWWLLLRITFNPYWIALRRQDDAAQAINEEP
jgi:hypothetical protein